MYFFERKSRFKFKRNICITDLIKKNHIKIWYKHLRKRCENNKYRITASMRAKIYFSKSKTEKVFSDVVVVFLLLTLNIFHTFF